MTNGDAPSGSALAKSYGMVPICEFGIATDGTCSLVVRDADVADQSCGLYIWLIEDEIVRIGSSKAPLIDRMKSHSRWIELRLTGQCRVSDPKKLARQTEDARRWQQALSGGKRATAWARQGTMVESPVGYINTYLAEENVLLERYKPRFNNSHFR
jgi:hypothetical protein